MARARVTLNIGGEKRFLKFTMSTFQRYDNSVAKEGAALTLLMANPMSALLALTIFALDWHGNENHLPPNLDNEMVGDWIDDLEPKELKRLVDAMMLTVKKFGDAFSNQKEVSMNLKQ